MGSRPWHECNPEEFARLRAPLERAFPYLHVKTREGHTVLAGGLPIIVDGTVADQFEIEVIVPASGLRSEMPVVREIGGRIPRHPDRHVEPVTGDACLCVRDEYWFKHPDGLNLVEFLQGPVTSYFVAQFSFIQGNGWPFGQRAHGANGIIEFYAKFFGVSGRMPVRRILEVVAAKKVRAHWTCPCGSSRHIRDCHAELIHRLRARIPRSAATYSLAILRRDNGGILH